MKSNDSTKLIGKIRRSQVLSNGPGAIIDFRSDGGAPLSVVSAGLETWDSLSSKKGLFNEQRISHEPLQARLKVKGFRLPPVGKEKSNHSSQSIPISLIAHRFPDWHVCPKCDCLKRSCAWSAGFGSPELYCSGCTTGRGRQKKKSFVVPVRFVVTCKSGHLQDFPWESWPRHTADCTRKRSLKLIGKGAGLKGLKVHCTECSAERDLDGALSAGALGKIPCKGRSPWLRGEPVACPNEPVAIQRGASNAYFPVVASALDVPPFGGTFRDSLEGFWDDLTALADRDQVPEFVRKRIHPRWPDQGGTSEQLAAKIVKMLQMLDDDGRDLRINEHLMLCSGGDDGEEFPEFRIVTQALPEELKGTFDRIASVERLREVRVLRGFTRLSPAEDIDSAHIASLSETPLNWLPAIEVRGEGIFLNFSERMVTEWEKRPSVVARAKVAHKAAERSWREHNDDGRKFPLNISPRFLLVHTTAHALIEQLSLESGYSTASIRERLYVSSGEDDASGSGAMCGFLLYTSAPDSDGTLGGLSRKGRSRELFPILLKALHGLEWCSSDPLCSSGILTLSEGSGSAACHSCCFLPETSCEHFNRHLDRAMLIGTPEEPRIGYFHNLLKCEG